MDDLISRAAVMKCLEELDALMHRRAETEDKEFVKVQVGITLASCEIEALPTVDAEPVVHAYWKLSPLPGRPLRAVCSWCGAEGLFSYNMHDAVMYYCHKCGRRMDADAPERGEGSGA